MTPLPTVSSRLLSAMLMALGGAAALRQTLAPLRAPRCPDLSQPQSGFVTPVSLVTSRFPAESCSQGGWHPARWAHSARGRNFLSAGSPHGWGTKLGSCEADTSLSQKAAG